jgi:hypothetical protein
MSVLPSLVSGLCGLAGASIGAAVARYSSRESNDLLKEQVASSRDQLTRSNEALRWEHRRAVRSAVEQLYAQRSEYVERYVIGLEEQELRQQGTKIAAMWRVRAEALIAAQRCSRDDDLPHQVPPREVMVPMLAAVPDTYPSMPQDLGGLLLALAADGKRYEDLAAAPTTDPEALWKVCRKLAGGFREAAALADRSLDGLLETERRLEGEIRSLMKTVEQTFDARITRMVEELEGTGPT